MGVTRFAPRRAPAALIAGALALPLACGLAPLAPFDIRAAAARGPESLAGLASEVSDAVVNISATQAMDEKRGAGQSPPEPGTPFDDLFDEFFKRRSQGEPGAQGPRAPRERRSNSLGSGFVIDPSGLVVTNNHVIADANEVTVIFTDGSKLKADVVGKDPKIDVAVLRVKPDKPLKAVKFGDSDRMRVGDWVIAVGNPFGLGGSVSAGIISAVKRNIDSGPYDNYFQTDAAINKGNSGGPLFNMDGEVIGVNTAILSPSGGSIGIGFSTPSSMIQPVVEQLLQYGETRRGWLGVRIQNVDDTIAESLNLGAARGALVAGADEKGPARAAGIRTGDIIVKFDGVAINESHELPKIVASAPVGKDVEVVILREGKEMTKTIRLGRLEEKDRKLTEAAARRGEEQKPPAASEAVERALGMTFSSLSDDARRRFSIRPGVGSGVVVTEVDPGSGAAEKRILAGEVVVEINQAPVKEPTDVARRLDDLKREGKKSALLLVANGQGEMRFVALPMP
ncbi:Do family serine endopeptidase [Methylocella sp.]|uniref:Do family serine endopeptidase n=1 Tax=Methylocella sp. TaxID=1978226 RepID=UPI0037840430